MSEPRGLVHHFAVPDRFITHGSRNELLEEVGLSPARVASRVRELLGA
jgi:deoxyxylulose-5-phosphate synthase